MGLLDRRLECCARCAGPASSAAPACPHLAILLHRYLVPSHAKSTWLATSTPEHGPVTRASMHRHAGECLGVSTQKSHGCTKGRPSICSSASPGVTIDKDKAPMILCRPRLYGSRFKQQDGQRPKLARPWGPRTAWGGTKRSTGFSTPTRLGPGRALRRREAPRSPISRSVASLAVGPGYTHAPPDVTGGGSRVYGAWPHARAFVAYW